MKRLIITILLTVIILATCISAVIIIGNSCDEMIAMLEEVERLCGEDSNELETACNKAEEKWCEIEPVISLFIDHDSARTVGESISELPPLALAEEKAELLSHCRAAKIKLQHIKNTEEPGWLNIL